MFHPFQSNIPSPRQFTYPFCYDVDPLAEAAAHELQRYIAESRVMSGEAGGGKMFGVLVVERADEKGVPQRGFLAAYSGLLGGRNDWPYFVPPVYDAQQPDGHFKQTEREISALNHEIAAIEHSPDYLQSVAQRKAFVAQLQAEVDAFKAEVDEAKARRDARRKSGEPISEAEQAELIRESQFMKAELRRRRKAMEQATSTLIAQHASYFELSDRIASLQRRRKQMSDELQRWLFSAYRVLNAKGEERDLIDIFREYTHAMPPAGAGDCCAPKLLQYAYQHGLRPVCMAEFWWGDSPASEIRHHRCYYPACRSKCLPILTHMLKGLDVMPNPLARSKRITEPRVVYEDEYILVVDKPAGMLSVPGKAEDEATTASCGSDSDDSANVSVEEYFAKQLQLHSEPTTTNSANNSTLHIPHSTFLRAAHRLDMDTSGLLVLARTEEAYVELQRQFASRETMKRYEAVLSGVPQPTAHNSNASAHNSIGLPDSYQGSISLPLIADIADRPRQRVDMEHGKPAITLYNIIKVDKGHALIHLYPKTGRTHQLRVHCAHPEGLACPILGDPLYGVERADRMYLHATELTFRHPLTGKPLHFISPSGFQL